MSHDTDRRVKCFMMKLAGESYSKSKGLRLMILLSGADGCILFRLNSIAVNSDIH